MRLASAAPPAVAKRKARPKPQAKVRTPAVAAGKVCLAYVHDSDVAYSWHRSILDLIGYDLAHHQRIVGGGGWFGMRCGTDGLPEARNKVAAQFLDGDAEWLFWIDTDMGFAPDTVDRLLASADPAERPVVGALCFAQGEDSLDGMGGFRCSPRPTLFAWAEKDTGEQGFAPMFDYPRDQLVEVAGTGSACLVIHRAALEKVAAEYGPVWYSRLGNPTTGKLIAEDLSFCARLLQVGLAVHVDTRVKTTHLKRLWLSEDDYRHPSAT